MRAIATPLFKITRFKTNFKTGLKSCFTFCFVLAFVLVTLTGCQKDIVHQRSIAELNQKAQTMMQSGNIDGAVARLEAARDLQPEEPSTIYNLAIAYQMQGQFAKAIQMFTLLLEHPGASGTKLEKAELQKAMAITYEAKADKLSADVRTLEDDAKTDKSQVAQMHLDTQQSYKLALDYYKQSIDSGLKNPADVQKQIADLEKKLSELSQPLAQQSTQESLP